MIPTEPSISGTFLLNPVEQETTTGAAMLRARVAIRPVVCDPDGTYRRLPAVEIELLMFGIAAEHALRHFRAGDHFVAAGPANRNRSRTTTFVATAIGHDARWTSYRVVRTNRRTRRSSARTGSRIPMGATYLAATRTPTTTAGR